MKFLNMQFSPTSCHFVPLRSTSTPSVYVRPLIHIPSFIPIHNHTQNYSFCISVYIFELQTRTLSFNFHVDQILTWYCRSKMFELLSFQNVWTECELYCLTAWPRPGCCSYMLQLYIDRPIAVQVSGVKCSPACIVWSERYLPTFQSVRRLRGRLDGKNWGLSSRRWRGFQSPRCSAKLPCNTESKNQCGEMPPFPNTSLWHVFSSVRKKSVFGEQENVPWKRKAVPGTTRKAS
jgi:hypothetical protein